MRVLGELEAPRSVNPEEGDAAATPCGRFGAGENYRLSRTGVEIRLALRKDQSIESLVEDVMEIGRATVPRCHCSTRRP